MGGVWGGGGGGGWHSGLATAVVIVALPPVLVVGMEKLRDPCIARLFISVHCDHGHSSVRDTSG